MATVSAILVILFPIWIVWRIWRSTAYTEKDDWHFFDHINDWNKRHGR